MTAGCRQGSDVRAGCRGLTSPAVTVDWTAAAEYEDIRYELSGDGIAKITIDRPEVHNTFRPQTIVEISDALEHAREDTRSA